MERSAREYPSFDGLDVDNDDCAVYCEDSGVPTSVASLLAAFCTIYAQAPLDVVRTRLYCGANNCGATVSPVKIAREIVQSEGVWAFWKGANINFFRYAPHAVLSFVFIEALQNAVNTRILIL